MVSKRVKAPVRLENFEAGITVVNSVEALVSNTGDLVLVFSQIFPDIIAGQANGAISLDVPAGRVIGRFYLDAEEAQELLAVLADLLSKDKQAATLKVVN